MFHWSTTLSPDPVATGGWPAAAAEVDGAAVDGVAIAGAVAVGADAGDADVVGDEDVAFGAALDATDVNPTPFAGIGTGSRRVPATAIPTTSSQRTRTASPSANGLASGPSGRMVNVGRTPAPLGGAPAGIFAATKPGQAP